MSLDLQSNERKRIKFLPTSGKKVSSSSSYTSFPSSNWPKITLSPILPVNVFIPPPSRTTFQELNLRNGNQHVINLDNEKYVKREKTNAGLLCCNKKSSRVNGGDSIWRSSPFVNLMILIGMIVIVLILVITIISELLFNFFCLL